MTRLTTIWQRRVTADAMPRLRGNCGELPPLDQTDLQADVGAEAFDRFEIVPPRGAWPCEFVEVAHELVGLLPTGLLRIDHVGSTAIPAMPAKDRIDVQVTALSLKASREWIAPLERIGYRYEPVLSADRTPADPWQREKLFFHRSETRPHVNLHIRELGRGNWRYALLFRDYLRSMSEQAAVYAEVEVRLAELVGGERSPYSYVKEPVCDLIFNAAVDWAGANEWDEALYRASNLEEFASE